MNNGPSYPTQIILLKDGDRIEIIGNQYNIRRTAKSSYTSNEITPTSRVLICSTFDLIRIEEDHIYFYEPYIYVVGGLVSGIAIAALFLL